MKRVGDAKGRGDTEMKGPGASKGSNAGASEEAGGWHGDAGGGWRHPVSTALAIHSVTDEARLVERERERYLPACSSCQFLGLLIAE